METRIITPKSFTDLNQQSQEVKKTETHIHKADCIAFEEKESASPEEFKNTVADLVAYKHPFTVYLFLNKKNPKGVVSWLKTNQEVINQLAQNKQIYFVFEKDKDQQQEEEFKKHLIEFKQIENYIESKEGKDAFQRAHNNYQALMKADADGTLVRAEKDLPIKERHDQDATKFRSRGGNSAKFTYGECIETVIFETELVIAWAYNKPETTMNVVFHRGKLFNSQYDAIRKYPMQLEIEPGALVPYDYKVKVPPSRNKKAKTTEKEEAVKPSQNASTSKLPAQTQNGSNLGSSTAYLKDMLEMMMPPSPQFLMQFQFGSIVFLEMAQHNVDPLYLARLMHLYSAQFQPGNNMVMNVDRNETPSKSSEMNAFNGEKLTEEESIKQFAKGQIHFIGSPTASPRVRHMQPNLQPNLQQNSNPQQYVTTRVK